MRLGAFRSFDLTACAVVLLLVGACGSSPTYIMGTAASPSEPALAAPTTNQAAPAPSMGPPLPCFKTTDVFDYRNPPRKYTRASVSGFEVQLEQNDAGKRSSHVDTALATLQRRLKELEALVPPEAYRTLRSTRIFVMRGGEPGVRGCTRLGQYFDGISVQASNLDPLWAHAVVFYSAKDLSEANGAPLPFITHELAHAYHELLNDSIDGPIGTTYAKAMAAGLYRRVHDAHGHLDEVAYAATNRREYFADLSAIYFTQHWEYPFNRQALRKYDAAGADMVRWAWAQAEGAAPPSEPAAPPTRVISM